MSLLRTATEAANDMNERQLILLLRAVALILEERAGGEKAKEVLRIIGSDMRAPDTASPGEATRGRKPLSVLKPGRRCTLAHPHSGAEPHDWNDRDAEFWIKQEEVRLRRLARSTSTGPAFDDSDLVERCPYVEPGEATREGT